MRYRQAQPDSRQQIFDSYLINLDSRKDRLQESLIEANKVGIDFTRVSAIQPNNLSKSELNNSLLTPGALACLRSHQKVWSAIVASDLPYGLILEDDFQIRSPTKFFRLIDRAEYEQLDLLQVGFLNMNFRYWIDIKIQNIESFIFILLSKFFTKKFDGVARRLRVKRHAPVRFGFVADDFRAGAHAYFISRLTAEKLLALPDTKYLTVDGFLCAIGWTRAFKVVRLSKSLINQRNSESSIRGWGSEGPVRFTRNSADQKR